MMVVVVGLKEGEVEEVQEDEERISRDEEKDRHASKSMVVMEGQRVKFERKMDAIEQGENENQWMRKVEVREKDWGWHFYSPEVLPWRSMFHSCLAFH